MTIIYKSINSSALRAASYDSHEKNLIVAFNNGSIYNYASVPAKIWKMFLIADSQGRFFNKYIKGKFKHEKRV